LRFFNLSEKEKLMHHFFTQSIFPTPVLNTPKFSSVFGGENHDRLLLDEKGHMRALEFVALSGTLFQILEEFPDSILRVAIPSYSACGNFFIDSRFTQPCKAKKTAHASLPKTEILLSNLEKLQGVSYLWGGNYSPGIPEIFSYYPPPANLDTKTKDHWMLKGADCSGILYEITEGKTPRNTSQLVHFGRPLFVENLSPKEIIALLRPLDLIVYVGHLIIVWDSSYTIESRESRGVVKTPIDERLAELFSHRTPCNSWPCEKTGSSFVIRRWL
jgi:hypothetical protein